MLTISASAGGFFLSSGMQLLVQILSILLISSQWNAPDANNYLGFSSISLSFVCFSGINSKDLYITINMIFSAPAQNSSSKKRKFIDAKQQHA